MKTDRLLQSLQTQLQQLCQTLEPLAQHRTLSARFDQQLFQTRSTLINDYLQECWHNLDALTLHVREQKTEQVAWLAEHLVAQMEALAREGATWSLRHHDSAHLPAGRRHAQLLQHQEYERRLLAMKQQREAQLRNVETLQAQQRLHKEIEALDGRLARCRHALAGIERALVRQTR
ncbi:primosomal replication protein PriC [Atlantibacter subterraneus]|uniref:primosomal replication protein PriC n=1 Tax=Atlantibacter subterraneus TaxID=255519 RepID=UPI002964B2E5|nr:primosomal replication protein PriC [Atlantibacter subterranea]MDW2741867.1 primosomal replication protein PriC [Atlantibacter subterranea]